MKHNIRQRVINSIGLPVVKIEQIGGGLASGVFDIRGKEIYEGDFVRLTDEGEIHEVKWDRGSLTVDGVNIRSCLDGSLEIVGGS